MAKFDFIQRVLLQRPTVENVKQVYNHIAAHFGKIPANIQVTTNRASMASAINQVNTLNRSLKDTKKFSDEFAGIIANATRRFAGISIATGTMLALARGVKNAYKESLEFERQMKRVEIATSSSQSEIRRLTDDVLKLGAAYGVSSLELANNARIFAQAGLNARTTSKALEILAKTSVAGTFGDISDTAEGVVASLQQFRAEVIAAGGDVQFLEKTFDSIQNVSKKYAIEAEDIVVGIRKAGSAFESAGGTINELIGVMTTLRSTTRESAATLGNAVKTIFTRIQRPETVEFLKEMGVELVDMEGKFVGPIEAVNRLGAALAVLDKGDIRYAQIADKIGGIYQINRLLTLLKNTTMTGQAIDLSAGSENVLTEDAQKGLETTIAKIERLKQSFFGLVKTFGESDSIRNVIDLLIRLADSSIKVTKALEPMMPLILMASLVSGGRFAYNVGKRIVGIGKNPSAMPVTQVGGYADGGRVWGGKPGKDTVPAYLDNGEFVVNKKDARKNLPFLMAINSGRKVPGFAKGTNINQRTRKGMNTLDPFKDFGTRVDLSTIKQDFSDLVQEISKFSLEAGKKIKSVVKEIYDTGVNDDRFRHDKTVYISSKAYRPETLEHEVGHAADFVQTRSGTALSSGIYGTINNLLSNAATPTAKKNAIDSGFRQGMVGYRSNPQEVYAELFQSVDAETKALMIELTSSSTNAADVNKALEKLVVAINKGAANFGVDVNNAIMKEGESRGIVPFKKDAPKTGLSNNQKRDRLKSGVYQLLNTQDDSTAGLGSKKSKNLIGSYSELSDVTRRKFGLPEKQVMKVGGGFKPPSGPKGPSSPGSPSGPKGPGPGGPSGPDPEIVNKTNSGLSNVNAGLLVLGGVLAFAASASGKLSESFESASASAATMFTVIKLLSSGITDMLPDKSFKDLIGGMGDMGGGRKGILGKAKGLGGSLLSSAKGSMSTVSGAASGLLTGAAVGMAGAQFISSYYGSEADAKQKQKNDILSNVSQKGGSQADLEKLLKLQGEELSNRNKSGSAMASGIGGIAGGAAIGSIIPGLGTMLGAAIGAAVGGIGGAGVGAAAVDNKTWAELESSTVKLTRAQYDAAKGMYDFDTALGNAKKAGLKGDDLTKVTSQEVEKARKSLEVNRQREGEVKLSAMTEGNRSWTNALTLGLVGSSGAGEVNSTNQKVLDDFKTANEQAAQTLARASQEDVSARKDSIIETINSAKSFNDLGNVSNNLSKNLDGIYKSAYDAVIGTEEEKKKAAEAEVKGTRDMIAKLQQSKGSEIAKIDAATRMRELELNAIKNTTSALLSLDKDARSIDIAEKMLQQFTTGSSSGVDGSFFTNFQNVSNRQDFNTRARGIGAQIPGGMQEVNKLINGSQFISNFRNELTNNPGRFSTINSSQLGPAKTKEAITAELSSVQGFSNLSKKEQEAFASTLQAELADNKTVSEAMNTAIDKYSSILNSSADILAKKADSINQAVDVIQKFNQSLIESQVKTAELRAGQVDILGTGASRMNQVMSRYGNTGTERAALDQAEIFRTQRSNTLLEGAGVAPIAGNINALSATLSQLESQKASIDRRAMSETDMATRANLFTENQKLANATRVVTDELNRLANQSDRAADIMSKIEKVRQERDYVGGRVKNFITGGRQNRMQMMEEVAGMQNVMKTGTFQNLPEQMQQSVMQMMEQRAKIDPSGQMQKFLDNAIANDARAMGFNPQQIAAALNKPIAKEEKLIQDLQALNVKEFQAQQALIGAQERNTQATLQLINQMSIMMGQRINPALIPQAPQMPGGQMPGIPQRLNGIANDFNNMHMNHQFNVNGQINLPGLNSDEIARQLTQSISQHVVQEIQKQMQQMNRGFRPGQ